jgi:molybdate transport system substrate-binding protein
MTRIDMLCSNGVKGLMLDCIAAYEGENRAKISITFGSAADLLQQIAREARGDFAVLTDEAIHDLAQRDTIVLGSRIPLARSGIAVAVRQGRPKPVIDTPEALRRALLAARSVAHSRTGVSGIYFAQLIERLGIAAELKDKLIVPDGRSVAHAVASGEAELGIQQLSELLPVAGIDIAGPLPADLQKFTLFEAAVLSRAADKQAATALLQFIAATSPPLVKRHGLEPA